MASNCRSKLVMFSLHYIADTAGCKAWRLQGNYLCNYFQSNSSYTTTTPQRYRQMDRQTTLP